MRFIGLFFGILFIIMGIKVIKDKIILWNPYMIARGKQAIFWGWFLIILGVYILLLMGFLAFFDLEWNL